MNNAERRGRRIQRSMKLAEEYRSGKTLAEIGTAYGVSRERIRQLLKGVGVTGLDGGRTFKTLVNLRYKADPLDRFLSVYGCSKREALAVNNNQPLRIKGTPAQRYAQQRKNALFIRQIGWEITLPQWMNVWDESGHWNDRGRGKGYCMTRIGDTGPYAVGNVEIKTIGENFSESYYKHPSAERLAKRIQRSTQASLIEARVN